MPIGRRVNEITNPDSVIKAIEEFDRLGPDVFLNKYGFGKAREFFLLYEGRRYDSKAIMGVAYGFEFPDRGHLTARDFTGGEATVARKLESLGFAVLRTRDPASSIPGSTSPFPGLTLVDALPRRAPKVGRVRPTQTGRLSDSETRAVRDARNSELGAAGESLVVDYERTFLINVGRADLADEVVNVPQEEGDGLGYDVRSFSAAGEVRYIEVKTTRGGIGTPFFLTANELLVSEKHSQVYYLYRVFDYSGQTRSGKLYIIRPPFASHLALTPVAYRAELRG